MPTNRTKRTRDRVIGAAGLTEAALSYFWWEGTIPNNAWAKGKTEAEILSFWKIHRRAILDWYIEKNRLRKGEPGKRPEFFWEELKATRKKIGKLGYFKPWTSTGPDLKEYFEIIYEEDYDFLKRLNLLEGWEKTAKRIPAYYEKNEMGDYHPVKGKKGGTKYERI